MIEQGTSAGECPLCCADPTDTQILAVEVRDDTPQQDNWNLPGRLMVGKAVCHHCKFKWELHERIVNA